MNARYLYYPTAMSATLVAYVPYLPLTPTPTSAGKIIFTSFAPSPIAKVKSVECYFT